MVAPQRPGPEAGAPDTVESAEGGQEPESASASHPQLWMVSRGQRSTFLIFRSREGVVPHGDFEKLTPETIDALWDRLQSGMAAKPAARQLGLCTGTVRAYLLRCGGIRPVPRARAADRLRVEEREEISRGLAAGLSVREIAAQLGRAPSTVSREVAAPRANQRVHPAPGLI